MTTITIPLAEDRLKKLNEMAARLCVSPEDLVRAGIEGLLSQTDAAFEQSARLVLEKNAELYRRLA